MLDRLEVLLLNAIDLLITEGYSVDEIINELGMTGDEAVKYLSKYEGE